MTDNFSVGDMVMFFADVDGNTVKKVGVITGTITAHNGLSSYTVMVDGANGSTYIVHGLTDKDLYRVFGWSKGGEELTENSEDEEYLFMGEVEKQYDGCSCSSRKPKKDSANGNVYYVCLSCKKEIFDM